MIEYNYLVYKIDDLTMAMFEDADPFNRGTITYEALKNQLEKHGGLLENLSIRFRLKTYLILFNIHTCFFNTPIQHRPLVSTTSSGESQEAVALR